MLHGKDKSLRVQDVVCPIADALQPWNGALRKWGLTCLQDHLEQLRLELRQLTVDLKDKHDAAFQPEEQVIAAEDFSALETSNEEELQRGRMTVTVKKGEIAVVSRHICAHRDGWENASWQPDGPLQQKRLCHCEC